MDADSVLFFRYLIAIPIIGGMIKARGHNFKVERRVLGRLIIMGLLVSISSLTLFTSYNYMEAGIASSLLFVYPVMVALIMTFIFREKIALRTILCLLMALGGIALLYRNSEGAVLSLTGTLLVMTSALSYSIYIVAVNRPMLKNIATLKITFYILLFGLSLFLVRTNFGASLILPGQWYLWFNLIALAIFPTVISFLCTTSAVQYIGSTPTAILGALEPVTAVFFGVTIFGESLTLRIVAGIALIILAVSFIVAGSNLKSYMIRFRKLFPKFKEKK